MELKTKRNQDGTFEVKVFGHLPAGTHAVDPCDEKGADGADGGPGHPHQVTLEKDLEPGQSIILETSPPIGDADSHTHVIRITAFEVDAEPEADAVHLDDDDKMSEHEFRSHVRGYEATGSAIETKRMGGRVVETKVEQRNGVSVGIVAGYLATWAPDTGGVFGVPDAFVRGAFAASIEEHKARGNRQVRLKDHHGRTIGGYPIETVVEDEVGLFGRGEINLETQAGREAFSLARQGVLTDFSVGFTALSDEIKGGIRFIDLAILWEGSVVDEPANQGAQILEVKARAFADLPLAQAGTTWDAEAAAVRVGALAPDLAARAFLIEGKLSIADVIGDTLVVVPDALRQAADQVGRSRPGVDISPQERKAAVRHLERYFAKMGEDSPFERKDRQFFGADEAKDMTARDLETTLASTGAFSKAAAKVVASRLTAAPESQYDGALSSLLKQLRGAINDVKQG